MRRNAPCCTAPCTTAAFASGAAVTLLDEPFAALDKTSIGLMLELLHDAAAHPVRAWVVAHHEAPDGLPLGQIMDLSDSDAINGETG